MGVVGKDKGKHVMGSVSVNDGTLTNAMVADDTLKEAKLNGALKTGTVATGGTPVTVAHALGAKPTAAWVVLGDAYVTAWDATNVTVNAIQSSVDFYVYALL